MELFVIIYKMKGAGKRCAGSETKHYERDLAIPRHREKL